MNKLTTVLNVTQKYILSQLKTQKYLRFKDMKPPGVSSNTLSYHLNALQKGGWIVKSGAGYTLGLSGLAFIVRDTSTDDIRMQPNVVVSLVVQDGYGKILLHKKTNQPYIGRWELPTAYMTVADSSVVEAGRWASKSLVHFVPPVLRHVGDCYVRLHHGKLALSATLMHIVRFDIDSYDPPEGYEWCAPLDIGGLPVAPGLQAVTERTLFNDDFFFEEYTFQLSAQESLGI